jgi:integrase
MLNIEEVFSYYLSNTEHTSKGRDRSALLRLSPFFSPLSADQLTRQDLRAYVAKRRADGVVDSTINREFRSFRAALNFYTEEHGLTFFNPLSGFSLAESDPRIRYLTANEAKRLIHAAKDHPEPYLECFIRLALATGCRSGEILKLQWSRVDFDHRYIILGRSDTKTKKRRFVPLNVDALETLGRLKVISASSAFVFPSSTTTGHIQSLKKGFRGACDRSCIYDFRIHDLRHTFASWLVQSGVSLYVVKELLGHSCITVTERYAHLHVDNLRAALLSLPTF